MTKNNCFKDFSVSVEKSTSRRVWLSKRCCGVVSKATADFGKVDPRAASTWGRKDRRTGGGRKRVAHDFVVRGTKESTGDLDLSTSR